MTPAFYNTAPPVPDKFDATGIIAFFFVIILAAIVFIILFIIRRKKKQKEISTQFKFFEVVVPEQNEIEIKAAEQMFSSLYGIRKHGLFNIFDTQPHISLEIVADENEIRFFVSCPSEFASLVEKQINAAYPDAQIIGCKPWNIWKEGHKIAYGSLKLSGKSFYPLRDIEDFPTDPLNGITSIMSKLHPGEGLVLQILAQPASLSWQMAGGRLLHSAQYQPAEGEKGKKVYLEPKLQEAIGKKIGKSGFNCVFRLVAMSEDLTSAQANALNLANAFSQFNNTPYNSFVFKKAVLSKEKFLKSFVYRLFPLLGKTSLLNTEELASVFHFPNKNVATPRIKWLKARASAAPIDLPSEGLYLGKSVFRGEEKKVYIMDDDRRRHMYIIGQTGTGKSEFLKFLAVQDIKDGKGLAFIDPHGSAIEDILLQMPRERMNDVIYFNAGDTERPLGLNILEARSEEEKHLLINSFIALLYKLYDPNRQGIMGPQLERAIRNVMLTAMSEPGNTMVEVLRLLIDVDFAKSKIPIIQDPLVKRYWTDEMAKTSDFHKSEKMGYFVSKFDRFVTEKLMRNIVGQSKSAFNIKEIMDNGKILLVDLSKGKIGDENSNFLGLLLVPRILSAALARATMTEGERRDFYLYVDEFQNFATPDFAIILSEARKYRLNLVVANQFIAQMQEDIKNAIFGNVGTLITFRVGIDDAEYLEHQFEPKFTKGDLINNPIGQAYLRLLVKGQPSPPFSLIADWSMMCDAPRYPETAHQIITHCRMTYGRDREEIEREIQERSGL